MDIGNGTQAQVGGFGWSSHRIGNTAYIQIYNDASAHSFLLHIAPSWDRSMCPDMGTITQIFHWSEPVPSEFQRVGP